MMWLLIPATFIFALNFAKLVNDFQLDDKEYDTRVQFLTDWNEKNISANQLRSLLIWH